MLIAIICQSVDGDLHQLVPQLHLAEAGHHALLDDSYVSHAPQPQRADHEMSVSGPNAKTPIPHPEPARVGIGGGSAAVVADESGQTASFAPLDEQMMGGRFRQGISTPYSSVTQNPPALELERPQYSPKTV